jgi:dTDP-4-dehydrorhamnose reductase
MPTVVADNRSLSEQHGSTSPAAKAPRMIWLIGSNGMLGHELDALLRKNSLNYVTSGREVDIADPDALRAFATGKPISWIINCSAYTAVDKAESEPEAAFRVNAAGPQNIAEISRDLGAKLVHISTDYVFDGTKPGAYVETDIANPLGVYGKSKFQGEVNIAQTFDRYFIVRTAWLYGKHGNNFVHTMRRLFNERDEVRVVGDQWGSPTLAPDLAAAVLQIVRLDSDAYGIYHFTNEGRITWHDFACEIYRLARARGLVREVAVRKISSSEYPVRTPRPANSYLSKQKISAAFGIEPRKWDVALDDYLADQPQDEPV